MAIKLIKDNYGDNNLPIASIYNNLGMTLKDQQKYDESIKYYNMTLQIRSKMLDKNHPKFFAVKHNIGNYNIFIIYLIKKYINFKLILRSIIL